VFYEVVGGGYGKVDSLRLLAGIMERGD